MMCTLILFQEPIATNFCHFVRSTSVNMAPVEEEDPVYEEILELDTSPSAGVVRRPAGQPLARATGHTSYPYEDVLAGDYQITSCAAYGVGH